MNWDWTDPKSLEDELESERLFNKFLDTLEKIFDPDVTDTSSFLMFDGQEEMAKMVLVGLEISEVMINAYSRLCRMGALAAGVDDSQWTPVEIVRDIRKERPRFGHEQENDGTGTSE